MCNFTRPNIQTKYFDNKQMNVVFIIFVQLGLGFQQITKTTLHTQISHGTSTQTFFELIGSISSYIGSSFHI